MMLRQMASMCAIFHSNHSRLLHFMEAKACNYSIKKLVQCRMYVLSRIIRTPVGPASAEAWPCSSAARMSAPPSLPPLPV